MGNLKGIDLSTWQGSYVDFDKIKKAGYEFVIIRAGFGRESSQIDNCFITNYNKAKKVGLKVGAYWYSYAVSPDDAIKEAKACIEVLKGKQFEMPIYYDVEENDILNKSVAEIRNIISNFCSTLRSSKYYCGITSFLSALEQIGTDFCNKYPVWVAQYYNKCTYTGNYQIWQHTSTAVVDGVKGSVDEDIYYKNKMDFESYIKKNGLNGYSNINLKPITPAELYIAFEVINGQWKAGEERKKELTKCGYNYNAIQSVVNVLLSDTDMFNKAKTILTMRE